MVDFLNSVMYRGVYYVININGEEYTANNIEVIDTETNENGNLVLLGSNQSVTCAGTYRYDDEERCHVFENGTVTTYIIVI